MDGLERRAVRTIISKMKEHINVYIRMDTVFKLNFIISNDNTAYKSHRPSNRTHNTGHEKPSVKLIVSQIQHMYFNPVA